MRGPFNLGSLVYRKGRATVFWGAFGGVCLCPGVVPGVACRECFVSDSCLISGGLVWPGLGPAADLPFFASPKKRRPKKGEPDALSLRFATGKLRCSVRAGSAQTCPLRGLRTCAALIRPALRYSPAHDGEGGDGLPFTQDEPSEQRSFLFPLLRGAREQEKVASRERHAGMRRSWFPHSLPPPAGEGVKTRSPRVESDPDPAFAVWPG